MTLDAIPPAALDFTLEVERIFAVLLHSAEASAAALPGARGEASLGGKLLYAGELIPHGRALLVAGNIAGAASLCATADLAAQKQAIRDGVADFLVNSLDEALRILKNEIRKREAVAVCVALAPESVQSEMRERGVRADIFPPTDFAAAAAGTALVAWTVASAPAQNLPRLDAIALDCLNAEDYVARRWLRLAPRYLGRMAQNVRVLHCPAEIAEEFAARARSAVDRGEIGVDVHIAIDGNRIAFGPSSKTGTGPLIR